MFHRPGPVGAPFQLPLHAPGERNMAAGVEVPHDFLRLLLHRGDDPFLEHQRPGRFEFNPAEIVETGVDDIGGAEQLLSAANQAQVGVEAVLDEANRSDPVEDSVRKLIVKQRQVQAFRLQSRMPVAPVEQDASR